MGEAEEPARAEAQQEAARVHESWRSGWRMLCRLSPSPLPGCGPCRAVCRGRAAGLFLDANRMGRRIMLLAPQVRQHHGELAKALVRISFDELAFFGLDNGRRDLEDAAFCLAVHALNDPVVAAYPMTQARAAEALGEELFGGPLSRR